MKRGSGVGFVGSGVPGGCRPRSCLPENTSKHRGNLALDSKELFQLSKPTGQSTSSSSSAGGGGGGGSAVSTASAPFSQPCLPVKDTGPTRILPYLYLGSYQDSLNERELVKLGIIYVLNVSRGTTKPPFVADQNFMRIPVDDNYDAVMTPYFAEAFKFIDLAKSSGSGSVLVHCMAGISRSATIAIAYFMREHNCTHEEAMRFVKERRPSIAPNFNFLGQLLELEKSMKSERMLRYHQSYSFGQSFRTSSESHISHAVNKNQNVRNPSSSDTDNGGEQIIVATSSRSLSVAMDEPKAPKRSRTDTMTSTSKARPTGLNLSSSSSNRGSKTTKELDIEALVQSSLHVKTPEAAQRENLHLGLTSSGGVEFSLHSPVCESSSIDSHPGTPGSSNKSSTHVASPMEDDSVFKMPLPLLPSPLSDQESTPSRYQIPKHLTPTTSSKTLSPKLSKKSVTIPLFSTSTGAISKHHVTKTQRRSHGPLEAPSDLKGLFTSESRLFHAFYSKPLSPVEDCSPENAAAASLSPATVGMASSHLSTSLDPSAGVLSDSSSTTTSSGTGPKTDSSAVRMKPITRHSRHFPKTKLMLSEKLKVMVKKQNYKSKVPHVWMSEGNIKPDDEKNRTFEVTPVAPRLSRQRPSSFCLPAEYLDHWEELLAAARLSSRSMSCNMLEVRSRPFTGNELFNTSSSSSYESLSRHSSLEAVEVGS